MLKNSAIINTLATVISSVFMTQNSYIQKVTHVAERVYYCIVKNLVGLVQSHTATIIVVTRSELGNITLTYRSFIPCLGGVMEQKLKKLLDLDLLAAFIRVWFKVEVKLKA